MIRSARMILTNPDAPDLTGEPQRRAHTGADLSAQRHGVHRDRIMGRPADRPDSEADCSRRRGAAAGRSDARCHWQAASGTRARAGHQRSTGLRHRGSRHRRCANIISLLKEFFLFSPNPELYRLSGSDCQRPRGGRGVQVSHCPFDNERPARCARLQSASGLSAGRPPVTDHDAESRWHRDGTPGPSRRRAGRGGPRRRWRPSGSDGRGAQAGPCFDDSILV
jgi:hypothetical protein